MSEKSAQRVELADRVWTGPKLIVLSFVVLAFCFALLWAMAEGAQVGPIRFGPKQHEADWGGESHFLEPGFHQRRID